MTAIDAPKPGGTTPLLNPRRSAHATIRGYLYQTCLGVLRWLELKRNEVLLCEGDEDLDRFLLGGEAVSEQVKAYTGGLNLSDRTVVESLGNFLRSYAALRRRGETRRFVFTTTAYEKKRRLGGLNFDLLEAWKKGNRKPEILDAVQSLLEPRENDNNREETAEAIAWLDAEPEGWQGFMDAVEWCFDAPDLDALRAQVKNRLAVRGDTSALPAETVLDRLVAHVLRTSSQPDPENRRLSPESLSGLIEEARTDLGNWVKTPAAERLRTVFDELKQVQHLLHDNTRSLPELASPGKLLTAAYEVIPFDEAGRREELDFLSGWCDSGDRRSVLLLTGEGGSGKTRLMIEWCRQLRHLGWHAGFFRPDRKAKDLDPLLEGVAPRFVVIDYAETRLPVVELLLLKLGLQAEGEGPKLRLVLLARRQADWWENLSRIGQQVEDLLLRSPEPRAITPLLPKDTAERERAFRLAVKGFSFQLGLKIPKDLPVPDLSRNEFERVLYLHMAALAALQGEHIETADGLLKQTLAHERQFWYDNASIFGSQRTLMSNAFESVMAAVTLIGGVTNLDTVSLTPRILKESPIEPREAFSISMALIALYAGPRDVKENRTVVEPLQPDLLGEELVAEALSRDEGLLGRVLDGAKPEEAYSTLTVLTRLARRRPECQKWIAQSLRSRPEFLAGIALNVAIETGDPIGLVLAEEIDSHGNSDTCLHIERLCREGKHRYSATLEEVGFAATRRALSILRENRPYGEPELAQIANLSNNFGVRLRTQGKYQEALEATEEAVQTRKKFANQSSEDVQADLARSIHNMGLCLSSLGDHQRAIEHFEECIKIRRNIAHNQDRYLLELAGSLTHLTGELETLERREEALDSAQEALKILDCLNHKRPEGLLYELAASLSAWGRLTQDLDLHQDSLRTTTEAVEIWRSLSTKSPNSPFPNLAWSLFTLGGLLRKHGRLEEAFSAYKECTDIYRRSTNYRPTFLPSLAASLRALSVTAHELDKKKEAADIAHEAMVTYQSLAKDQPDIYLPYLTKTLDFLILTIEELDAPMACSISQALVQTLRKTSEQQPQTFQTYLAKSLHSLAVDLFTLGRYEESNEALEEALTILPPLIHKSPEDIQPLASLATENYLVLIRATGQAPNALLLEPVLHAIKSVSSSAPED